MMEHCTNISNKRKLTLTSDFCWCGAVAVYNDFKMMNAEKNHLVGDFQFILIWSKSKLHDIAFVEAPILHFQCSADQWMSENFTVTDHSLQYMPILLPSNFSFCRRPKFHVMPFFFFFFFLQNVQPESTVLVMESKGSELERKWIVDIQK